MYVEKKRRRKDIENLVFRFLNNQRLIFKYTDYLKHVVIQYLYTLHTILYYALLLILAHKSICYQVKVVLQYLILFDTYMNLKTTLCSCRRMLDTKAIDFDIYTLPSSLRHCISYIPLKVLGIMKTFLFKAASI